MRASHSSQVQPACSYLEWNQHLSVKRLLKDYGPLPVLLYLLDVEALAAIPLANLIKGVGLPI